METKEPKIFVISGPGGVGKGTVVAELLKQVGNLWLSRSCTTRARRNGESEDAYTFLDEEAFLNLVNEGKFLEWAKFLDHYYGTPWPEPPQGSDVLLEIDVQGARQVLEKVPERAKLIFLMPPSPEAQRDRLTQRGDSAEHVEKRVKEAKREEEAGIFMADVVVVNDEIGKTVAEIAGIIRDWRKS